MFSLGGARSEAVAIVCNNNEKKKRQQSSTMQRIVSHLHFITYRKVCLRPNPSAQSVFHQCSQRPHFHLPLGRFPAIHLLITIPFRHTLPSLEETFECVISYNCNTITINTSLEGSIEQNSPLSNNILARYVAARACEFRKRPKNMVCMVALLSVNLGGEEVRYI